MARPAPPPEPRPSDAARPLTDHLLLRWCQQSGPDEARVAAPASLALDRTLAGDLRRSAVALDALLRRFADALLARDVALADFALPDFPLAKDIYSGGPLRAPFFWGRFDMFERAGGGLAALEYNCDKPAGQREIWASEEIGPARGNPNRGARARFRRELAEAWRRRAGSLRKRPRVAILCDPAHREEFRLAYLFGEAAGDLGWEWEVVDPLTLLVDNDRVIAYGLPVDVVLRHYPAEYLHELPAARGLLDARVLWLNDPRAVVAQAKSAFAALWTLLRDGRWLTRAETALVERLVPPRRRWLPSAGGGQPGYVNWGVYLAGGKPAGISPRCQPTPLTDEGTVWWAPPSLQSERPETPMVLEPALRARRGGVGVAWRAVADRHALTGYTNCWTDGLANFTLAAIGLAPGAYDELQHATLVLGRAAGRVLEHLRGYPELLGVLGIPETLASLCASSGTAEAWSFLSRFDWAWTTQGRWKLLEINSDTPAGLWEAASIEGAVAGFHPGTAPLSAGFWPALASSWRRSAARSLGDGAANRSLNVGLVGALGSPEDADQLRAQACAARIALPRAKIQIASPDDLVAKGSRVGLAGQRLDILFRYYPLDWLAEPRWAFLVEASARGTVALLPAAHVLIPQSKAFLALLWELGSQGFFPPTEAAAITRYVARTALGPEPFGRGPYIMKPYLEREGRGVLFSSEIAPRDRRRIVEGAVICQERLDVLRLRVPVATARGWRSQARHLIFGVFLAGNDIAGIYTRAGARITGREAVYLPALLRSRT